jgi:hypothetical protein
MAQKENVSRVRANDRVRFELRPSDALQPEHSAHRLPWRIRRFYETFKGRNDFQFVEKSANEDIYK